MAEIATIRRNQCLVIPQTGRDIVEILRDLIWCEPCSDDAIRKR